jgi:uncharacterized membrane protein
VFKTPTHATGLLIAAWLFWTLSLVAVLASYYGSQQALRLAIKQLDDRKIYMETPGGPYAKLTATLNKIGALLFVLGLFSMIGFIAYNI